MEKPLILVTGSNGQLGKELKVLSESFPDFRFVFLSREDLPIHHFETVRQVFKGYQPAYCLNCAAYTAVDKAEQEKDLAFLINAEAVGVLAAVCKEYGTKFMHVSTDYVFDGKATVPYLENDPVGPINVYGASKLSGEQQCMELNDEAIILRTSWVFSAFNKNFVKTMLALFASKPEIRVVNDQHGCPTYAAHLAAAMLHIIKMGKWLPGIYHYCNSGITSWYDFSLEIARISKSTCKVLPIPALEFPTPAQRPGYSVLNTSKIQDTFGLAIEPWQTALSACIGRL